MDLDKTREFYKDILGFEPVRCDTIKIKEGGEIRHIFFDTGIDQLLAHMGAKGVPGVAVEYDAGINRGLGMPNAFYHFAFEAGTESALEQKKEELRSKGVEVSEVVDHYWANSIYCKDPNGMQMEYSRLTREFTAEDSVMAERFEAPIGALGLEQPPDIAPTSTSR